MTRATVALLAPVEIVGCVLRGLWEGLLAGCTNVAMAWRDAARGEG